VPNSYAVIERRDHVVPSDRVTAPASQTRVVLQVLVIIDNSLPYRTRRLLVLESARALRPARETISARA